MSGGLLPHTVNTRKAIARDARYSGTLGAAQLEHFSDVLSCEDASAVNADVSFSSDDEGRQIATVHLRATVTMECQRCLERFKRDVSSSSDLAIVRTDEEAKHLPERYEPLITGEDTDLWHLVGEELALALPVVGMHPEGECPASPLVRGKGVGAEKAAQPAAGDTTRPFADLSSLLQGRQEDSSSEGGR